MDSSRSQRSFSHSIQSLFELMFLVLSSTFVILTASAAAATSQPNPTNSAETLSANLLSLKIHSQLAYLYASCGDRQWAIAQLKEAERLIPSAPSGDIDTERLICLAYAALNEP